jgi:hypothetical protein
MTQQPPDPNEERRRALGDALRQLGDVLSTIIPPKWRPAAAAALVLVAALLGIVYAPTQLAERPAYLATAVYRPDASIRDANLLISGSGRVTVRKPEFDKDGHAKPPSWGASCLAGIPCPAAPLMDWEVHFMQQVVDKQRPLRFCADELRQWDAKHPGKETTAIAVQAVRDVFDNTLDILDSEENCAAADLVLGPDAEVAPPNCGPNAWGCAALLYDGGRSYVRVTFCGTCVLDMAQPMPLAAVRGVLWHEGKHAANLGHCGVYGGEGKPHPHPCDLGYIGWDGNPVDNPTGFPAREDWLDPTSNSLRYGAHFRGQARPTPTPTPRPTLRPKPTPQPSFGSIAEERWTLRDWDPTVPCPTDYRSDGWCVVTSPAALPIPSTGAWFRRVRLNAAGALVAAEAFVWYGAEGAVAAPALPSGGP